MREEKPVPREKSPLETNTGEMVSHTVIPRPGFNKREDLKAKTPLAEVDILSISVN